MKKITYHIEERVVKGRVRREFIATADFFGKDGLHGCWVLFTGLYWPDFGDIQASFSATGRNMSTFCKIRMVCKFAKYLVS